KNNNEDFAQPYIIKASELLKVDANKFKSFLCGQSHSFGDEKIIVKFSSFKIKTVRDSLAKVIYSFLFEWIVKRINMELKSENLSTNFINVSIKILDIFGFENIKKNSFEQFCINYVNEFFQMIMIQSTLEIQQDEYEEEGFNWSRIDYEDNTNVVNLFTYKPHGLIPLLEDECKEKDYEMGFREKNLNDVNKDIINLLRDSKCSLVRQLTSIYISLTKARRTAFDYWRLIYNVFKFIHNLQDIFNKKRDSRTSINSFNQASENIRNSVESSTSLLNKNHRTFLYKYFDYFRDRNLKVQKDKDTQKQQISEDLNKQKRQETKEKHLKPSLGFITYYFQNSLNNLQQIFSACECYYIKCIKPNAESKPLNFDKKMVSTQLKYTGLIQTIKIRQAGYNYRFKKEEFYNKYKIMLTKLNVQVDLDDFFKRNNILSQWHRIGKTKIFFKPPAILILNKLKNEKVVKNIKVLQHTCRDYLNTINIKKQNYDESIDIIKNFISTVSKILYFKNKNSRISSCIFPPNDSAYTTEQITKFSNLESEKNTCDKFLISSPIYDIDINIAKKTPSYFCSEGKLSCASSLISLTELNDSDKNFSINNVKNNSDSNLVEFRIGEKSIKTNLSIISHNSTASENIENKPRELKFSQFVRKFVSKNQKNSESQISIFTLNSILTPTKKSSKLENRAVLTKSQINIVFDVHSNKISDKIFIKSEHELFTYYSYLMKKITQMNENYKKMSEKMSSPNLLIENIFISSLTCHAATIFELLKNSLQGGSFTELLFFDIYKYYDNVSKKYSEMYNKDNISPVVIKNSFDGILNEFLRKKILMHSKKLIKGHGFKSYRVYNRPTCEICEGVIWENAIICTECKTLIHRDCAKSIKIKCKSNNQNNNTKKFFGISLSSLCKMEQPMPPKLFELLNKIENIGMDYKLIIGILTEGIYRKTGNIKKIKELYETLNNIGILKEKRFLDNSDLTCLNNISVHVLSNIVKYFFRELPHSPIPEDYFTDIINATTLKPIDMALKFWWIISAFSFINRSILDKMALHLAKISTHEENNKMSPNSLSIIFTPCFFKHDHSDCVGY
ncbi:hypothetical protein HZS_5791, partial [Henneguya salminicola]